MSLKKFALIPDERKKLCNHRGFMYWTGQIPCTGQYRCIMCGYVKTKKTQQKLGY